jgi:hypothetical protein
MKSLLAFLTAAGLTLFFVRRHLKHLTASQLPHAKAAPAAASGAPASLHPCPRSRKSIA